MLSHHSLPLVALIVLMVIMRQGLAKKCSNTFTVPVFRRNNAWSYIDRMHLNPGHMTVSGSVSFQTPNFKQGSVYHLELVAIPESIWQKSLAVKCDTDRLTADEWAQRRQKQMVYHMDLTAGKGYVQNFVSKMQVSADQTYSFVLRDCQKRIINDGYGREAKLEIELDVRNNDQHISAGEQVYGSLLPVLLISALGILYFLHKEKEEQGDNWIKITLKVSLWMSVASVFSKYIGYLVYAYGSGVEHGVFDIFYLLFHAGSDSIIMVLLMLLAYGWTVTFKNAPDFDLYVPLACMLGLVNVIMTMLNKISDGEHDKYHMYDTIPAYIMIGFRLVGLLVFLIGLGRSWYFLTKQNQPKIRRYLLHMTVLGFLYIAFVPICFVLIRYVGTRYRKEGMFFGVEMMRFGLSYWLAWLAGWKRSAYRLILGESFMQKGEKYY